MIAIAALALATQAVPDLRSQRRVLIVAAPAAADTRRLRQLDALKVARDDLNERDVTVLDIAVDRVSGEADALRRHWHLPRAGFTVLLVGKDGHEALRRTAPVTAVTLMAAIDAMPMRRAGLR